MKYPKNSGGSKSAPKAKDYSRNTTKAGGDTGDMNFVDRDIAGMGNDSVPMETPDFPVSMHKQLAGVGK